VVEQPAKRGRWVNVGAGTPEIAEETWDAYWTEMTGEESMNFLRDPKTSLVEDGILTDDFRVQTNIINTEVASVAGDPHCKVLLVFPDEKFAMLHIYRHPAGR